MYRDSAITAARKTPEVVLIGVSRAIQELRDKIDRIAGNQNPVLILGETGTGKEVIARKVHESSGLRRFVPIDCSVLVGPLMESELFGYIKGAFTGANDTRQGLLEEAHLGTAFFDEVGELPLALQVKLLRVLQEREFRPLGSTVSKYVECRVLAATNRDLTEEVQRGRFRQDLFYRLNVITLRIPPLRERREDIPLLAHYFLTKHAAGSQLSDEVEDVFLHYDWPGNVRELENCIHRMAAVSSSSRLRIVDLPSPLVNSLRAPARFAAAHAQTNAIQGRSGVQTRAAAANGFDGTGIASGVSPNPFRTHLTGAPSVSSPLPQMGSGSPSMQFADHGTSHVLPLVEVERRAILSALHATRGDRTTAAQLLGIGRTTLYRKLKSYGFEL